MNKSELIDAVAASAGLTKADASRAIDATTAAITAAPKKVLIESICTLPPPTPLRRLS